MHPLSPWQNFYVVVGSAAGALTGLQFVSMAVLADMPVGPDDVEASTAFSTPSIVHFGTVLLLAAVLVMPWRGIAGPAIVWALAGLAGILYILAIARRMRRQQSYRAGIRGLVLPRDPPPRRLSLPLGLSSSRPVRRFRRPVCPRRSRAPLAVHRHSKHLGQHHLPDLRQKAPGRLTRFRRPLLLPRRSPAHSARRASTGFTDAALRAGR